MSDVEKIIKGLNALYDSMHKNQCYACSHEFIDLANEFGTEIIAEAVTLIEEQQKKIKQFELEKSWEESPERMNGGGW